MKYRTGIGQDSHRFLSSESSKKCIVAGITFDDDVPGLQANSDGDVVFHAICNAITSISGVLILGGLADDLCLKDGITDSEVYLREAVKTLKSERIEHVSITIEAKKPKFVPKIAEMKKNIARILGIDTSQVGITATTGEALTDFGRGEGIQAIAIITTSRE